MQCIPGQLYTIPSLIKLFKYYNVGQGYIVQGARIFPEDLILMLPKKGFTQSLHVNRDKRYALKELYKFHVLLPLKHRSTEKFSASVLQWQSINPEF